MNSSLLNWKFGLLFFLLSVFISVLFLPSSLFTPRAPNAAEHGEKKSAAGMAEKKTGQAADGEEDDETSEETTAVIDLVKAGVLRASPAAIRGRTARGQTTSSVPPFRVLRRKESLENYPCSDCHEDEAPNPKERKLTEEHEDVTLDHGQGQFWCLTCHGTLIKDALSSLKGKPIDFDFAFALCGQCHFQRQKDWYFGAHGKRAGAWRKPREAPLTHDKLKVKDRATIGSWKGPRVILSCPACHDPHSPSIKPFFTSPPPKVRKGLLPRGKRAKVHVSLWERYEQSSKGH